MKYTLLLVTIVFSLHFSYAQVGINTTDPEGALDIVAVDQGIVVPRVSAVENVITPDGSPAVDGTIVYDLSRSKMCTRIAGAWACTGATGVTNTIFTDGFENISNYIKATNTDAGDNFGYAIDLSADGNTLVIGARNESSNAMGVNGDQSDNSSTSAGATYVYTRSGAMWMFEAYLKASNADVDDFFGSEVSISNDGTLIAVAAIGESSNATGIDGDQTDNSEFFSGAVYIFIKNGGSWSQEAYIKASNTGNLDRFGDQVSLSGDGTRLAVSAPRERSNATGVNGIETNNSAASSGAVYVFLRTSGVWAQEAYLKASNTGGGDRFGQALGIDNDGTKIIIGATQEDSNATGIDGNPFNNNASNAGAAYLFSRTGTTWSQDTYFKSSNSEAGDGFGTAVSINGAGTILVVSAIGEDSSSTGINGMQDNNDATVSGAVYIFYNNSIEWTQNTYIKASNTAVGDNFGGNVDLSSDGNTLLVYAEGEDSNATGINGDQLNNTASFASAVYSYRRLGDTWLQNAYIKASNTESNDRFGSALSLSADGSTAAMGAVFEDSNAIGVGGNQADNTASAAGAVYIVE